MRVITFSTVFPKGHIDEGKPTQFVDKINLGQKIHTIRQGNRWKKGDMVSLRIWSDKPYRSKQIEFDQKEIVAVYDVYIDAYNVLTITDPDNKKLLYSTNLFHQGIIPVAHKDGLTYTQFLSWFSHHKYFSGQMICFEEPQYLTQK